MSDVAIRVEGLGKKYRLGLTHKGTIRDAVHSLGRRLFGRNGKGTAASPASRAKSQKWRANRLRPPLRPWTLDSRPSTSLGTGFHPELTEPLEMPNDQGRTTKETRSPNHETSGSSLPAPASPLPPREIDLKFDEIGDFAGVEKVIDTPVKRYSSGMHAAAREVVGAGHQANALVEWHVIGVGKRSPRA